MGSLITALFFLLLFVSCGKDHVANTDLDLTGSSSSADDVIKSSSSVDDVIKSSSSVDDAITSSSSADDAINSSSSADDVINSSSSALVFKNISLKSSVSNVQPMTGIVLWNNSGKEKTNAIQLEYSYMKFSDIAVTENPAQWNWTGIEKLLNNIAANKHQAVLRFYYTYPGKSTTVPQYIKAMSDYHETTAKSEGLNTDFPDWSHQALKDFTKEFYTQFALKYDNDPRIAFLQVGFGLWGEYHIYDPKVILGGNFPDKAYQKEFFLHLSAQFSTLHWSISIDAASSSTTPLSADPSILALSFGLFDDSFLHSEHSDYNKSCFKFFGAAKRMESPVGGEISYYSDYDQEHALDLPNGPHGVSYEQMAAEYNVSYMIANDQPNYQTMDRIRDAGIASGYRFEITAFKASSNKSLVTFKNTGVAPIYYHAYPTINGTRATLSLKGLVPGESKEFEVLSGGDNPVLTIECDRLVPGQKIEFDANL